VPTVSKPLRYQVLRRENYACRYCGRGAPEVRLEIDAVVPEALGGSHKDPANLVAACSDCNRGKAASSPDAPLVADVAQDALRWASAMQQAAAEMLARSEEVTEAQQRFDAAWGAWTCGERKQPVPRDPGWKNSVDALLAAGLPIEVIEECIHIAMSRRNVSADGTFRYMCGVAWKKVTQLQERARQIAVGEAGDPVDADENSPYDQGRIDAAEQVLAEMSGTEREYYIDCADDGGWGDANGDPQTDAERLTYAAAMACSDYRTDLHELEVNLVDTLHRLPGEIGQKAMRTARVLLYDHTGPEFTRRIFLIDSLRHLEDGLRFESADAYLSGLQDCQRSELLSFARALYGNVRVSEAGWIVRAAMCAEVISGGGRYHKMCGGKGETIDACPQVGTYSVRLAELECCRSGDPDHQGHPFCEGHLEELVDGTFVSPKGRTYAVTDYAQVQDDVWAPF